MKVHPESEAPYAHAPGSAWTDASDWFSPTVASPLWRDFCDELHGRLIRKWTRGHKFSRALKTDLFDEVAGSGLVGELLGISGEVWGVDICESVVRRAAEKHPELTALAGDVRALGFQDASADLVLSNSTFDHFSTRGEILRALAEMSRVLKPGGIAIVTLDNPTNPFVALRNSLPQRTLRRIGLVPYFIGQTFSMAELARGLGTSGLEILDAVHIMHVPRVAALHFCRLFDGRGPVARRVVEAMLSFECLAGSPTAALTGHYSAVLARKP